LGTEKKPPTGGKAVWGRKRRKPRLPAAVKKRPVDLRKEKKVYYREREKGNTHKEKRRENGLRARFGQDHLINRPRARGTHPNYYGGRKKGEGGRGRNKETKRKKRGIRGDETGKKGSRSNCDHSFFGRGKKGREKNLGNRELCRRR